MTSKKTVVRTLCGFVAPLAIIAFLNSDASAASADDSYIKGYVTAVLEREFNLFLDSLRVEDGVLTLTAEDLVGADREKVVARLSSIRGVVSVKVVEPEGPRFSTTSTLPQSATATDQGDGLRNSKVLPIGFLREGLVFDPLLADPRWPHFSVSYQRYIGDRDFKSVAAVSFGETFSLYRDNLPFGGQGELGLQASVFAIFDLDAVSKDLINADYFVGLPVSYRNGAFSGIARVFHQSSHLGDDFLLRSRLDRVNLSYESVDIKLSYDLIERVFRIYGGAGVLFDQEPADLKPWSTQFGVELQSPWAAFGGAVKPILAADLQNRQQNGWSTDLSIRGGIQFESLQVLGRKVQLMVEYFNGHSPNGQFYKQKIDYIGLGGHLYY